MRSLFSGPGIGNVGVFVISAGGGSASTPSSAEKDRYRHNRSESPISTVALVWVREAVAANRTALLDAARVVGAAERCCGSSQFAGLRFDVGLCGAGKAFSYLLAVSGETRGSVAFLNKDAYQEYFR